MLGTKVETVEPTDERREGAPSNGGENKTLEAEMLLSAVGRAPVTEDIGLEKTDIKLERGFIKTDDLMRTTEPNVYAIGDVVPTPDAGARGIGARASSRWSTSPGRTCSPSTTTGSRPRPTATPRWPRSA